MGKKEAVLTKDGAKVLGAVAAGLALGAALGFLVAPDSGRRTRRRIVRAMGDSRDVLVRRGSQATREVSEYVLDQFERSKRALSQSANG